MRLHFVSFRSVTRRGSGRGSRKVPAFDHGRRRVKPGSGIDAVQTICSDNPIPVIFITARPDAARSRMPQHPVLSKPFRVSEVEAVVREVMSN